MKTARIEDLSVSISSGITPLRSNPEFWIGGSVPWLKTEQLGQKDIYDTNEYISEIALHETSIKLNPKNTLSIAMYGEGKTRGNVSILRAPMTTNQACCNVVLNEELADVEYIYYGLKNQYYNLRNLSSGVRKNLNSGDIKDFEIALPETLADQKRIAKVLSTLDAKIEINNRINAELEAIAKLLYDYWFVQFDFPMTAAQAASLGRPELEGQPYKTSGGKMIYNSTLNRSIPEGWNVSTIGKTFKTSLGGTPSRAKFSYWKPEEVKWLSSGEKNSTFVLHADEHISKEGLKNSAAKLLKSGTVILSIVRHIRASILGVEAATNQSVVGIDETADLKHCFIYPLIGRNIPRYMTLRTGAQQPHINKALVDETPFPFPSGATLREYTSKASPLYQQIQNLQKQNQALTELRDWLLPMLMNGQVTVGGTGRNVDSDTRLDANETADSLTLAS